MALEKYMTYHRHDPNGRITVVEIRNDAELRYHESLVENGYRYTALHPKQSEAPAPSKPRIHIGDNACTACEG